MTFMEVGFARRSISLYIQNNVYIYIYIYLSIYLSIYLRLYTQYIHKSRHRQQRYIRFRMPHKMKHNISATEHPGALQYSRSHTTPRYVQKSLCAVSGAKVAGARCSQLQQLESKSVDIQQTSGDIAAISFNIACDNMR